MYSISPVSGVIKSISSFKFGKQNAGEAYFVAVMDQLILISGTEAATVGSEGSISMLNGYNGTMAPITDLKSVGDKIFIGLGSTGLAEFQYNKVNGELAYSKTSTFAFRDGKG